jgi:probable HAF family extracellular repeat protein
MAHSSLGLSRRRWAAIFLGAGALVASACSSVNSVPGFGGGASPTRALTGRPLSSTPTPPPSFTFTQVNYPTKGAYDEVTGVDLNNAIVGTYLTEGQYYSFTALCYKGSGYTINCSSPTFSPAPYPYTNKGVYLNANINSTYGNGQQAYAVGYVISPGNADCNTCGVLYDEKTKTYTVIRAGKEGTGVCKFTELLGINGSKIAVGFYKTNINGGCRYQAFEWYDNTDGTQTSVDLNVPNTSGSEALGINNGGDVVGTATTTAGIKEAWYYNDYSYTPFYKSQAISTEPRSINWEDAIVGDYKDSSSTYHGFLVFTQERQLSTYPEFVPIDYPATGAQTIVNSIDPFWRIAGWYWKSSSSATQGFVGNCTANCPDSVTTQEGYSSSRRPSSRAGARGGAPP